MAGHDSRSPKQSLVVVRAVLAAMIRMQQHFFFRLSAYNGHLQSSVHQGLLYPVVHHPTDNSAWIGIERNGQIQQALGRPHVGHVRDLVPVGAIRGEMAIQVIRRNRQSMTTAGNQPPALARANAQISFAHQPGNPVSTTRMPHGRQFDLDSAMAIDPIHLMVDGANLFAQASVRHLSRRRRPLLPCIETAARYPQQPAHWRYGVSTGQRRDGEEPHFVGCEKMAGAFLKHRAP